MEPTAVGRAIAQAGLRLPFPSGDVFTGLADIGPLLVTAIPLGVYNFTEGMNNVESAEAAGDSYNLRKILLADGIGAVVGSLLGSPFPSAVYIGHPGWKAVGGRIGYSLATGVCVGLVCFLGLVALLLAVIPLVAILPILLYIGIVIGAQAFDGPRRPTRRPSSWPSSRTSQPGPRPSSTARSTRRGRRRRRSACRPSPARASSTAAWSSSAAARSWRA
jgi:AGZA family xanthine/uracil permease-like MFS transporter